MEIAVINAQGGAELDNYEEGDILCVCPDGHPWTRKERNSPRFDIVSVPGNARDFKYLAYQEHPDVPDARTRRYRLTATGQIQDKRQA